MDTEIQEWYCDICYRKYPLNQKDEHIRSNSHNSNLEFRELASDYELYRLCRLRGLTENTVVLTFQEFAARRREADCQYEISKKYESINMHNQTQFH